MSMKHDLKRLRREAQRVMRPTHWFHSSYAGLTDEQCVEKDAANYAEGKAAMEAGAFVPIPPVVSDMLKATKKAMGEKTVGPNRGLQDTRTVQLEENPSGSIQEGSLRAAVVEALRSGRGTMTMAELSQILKRDARPVVAMLQQKGWVRRF